MNYPRDFEPLNALLSQWLLQRQQNPVFLPPNLPVVWTQIVGDLLARYCRPVKLEGYTLYIEASSEAWSQALAEQRPFLLRQLKTHLPKLSVREIQFSVQGPS